MTTTKSDRDLSFLEFKDGDDDIRALKAEMQMLMAMPEDERRYFVQEERVQEDERYLQWMVDSNKYDDELAAYFSQRSRSYVEAYQSDGDEKSLEIAEMYLEMARGTKQSKFTIGDIRKQRERVQWQRKKLNQMTKPSSEHGQSSEV